MIVVDNSLLVPNFVEAPNSDAIRVALSHDRDWLVPPLWRYEFVNALTVFRRAGSLTEWEARDTFAQALTELAPRERATDQNAVLRLAFQFNLSGYDAQYAALAEEYGILCVTNEQKLARNADRLAILYTQFTAAS